MPNDSQNRTVQQPSPDAHLIARTWVTKRAALAVTLEPEIPRNGPEPIGVIALVYEFVHTEGAAPHRRQVTTLRVRAARDFARALLRAADAAERIDDGDSIEDALAAAPPARSPEPRASQAPVAPAKPMPRPRAEDLTVRTPGAPPQAWLDASRPRESQ